MREEYQDTKYGLNRNKMKKKLHIVKWVDSYSNSRWYEDKEIDEWIKA